MRFQHCFEWLPIGRAMAGSFAAVGANEGQRGTTDFRVPKSLPTIHEVKTRVVVSNIAPWHAESLPGADIKIGVKIGFKHFLSPLFWEDSHFD